MTGNEAAGGYAAAKRLLPLDMLGAAALVPSWYRRQLAWIDRCPPWERP